MPRYLIHVGPHKTGTTYLQMTMRHLREKLREAGILFRADWGISDDVPSHHRLFQRIAEREGAALEQEFAELNRSSYELVVISSEDLSILPINAVSYLHALLGGAEATVVFYCRRWADLIVSGWQELVKHGHSETLLEMAMRSLANPHASSIINFALTLDRYAAAFGKENIRIVSYDVLAAEGQDLAAHFFRSFLGHPIESFLPPGETHRASRVNVSLSAADTELIRVLNAIAASRSGKAGAEIRTGYIKARHRLDLGGIVAAMERHRASIRIDEQAPVLRNLHQAIFQRYGGCVVPPRLESGLFPTGISEATYIHPNYLLEPGIADALLRAFEALQG